MTAPWPVSNRDFVVHIKITQDSNSKVIVRKIQSIPSACPQVEDHVRIIHLKAVWTITPLKNGFVNIEYQFQVEPEGNIPAWLVNLAAAEGPFETINNLRVWVRKEKYQNAVIKYIQELEK